MFTENKKGGKRGSEKGKSSIARRSSFSHGSNEKAVGVTSSGNLQKSAGYSTRRITRKASQINQSQKGSLNSNEVEFHPIERANSQPQATLLSLRHNLSHMENMKESSMSIKTNKKTHKKYISKKKNIIWFLKKDFS